MNKKVAVIRSEFNPEITLDLEKSCLDELKKNDIREIDQFCCPGSVELVQVANKIIKNKKYDSIILIGAIIKGETDHYEYVCNLVTQSFSNFIMSVDIPVVFGVLTTENDDLAEERSNPAKMNKGKEFAECAIKMMNLFEKNS